MCGLLDVLFLLFKGGPPSERTPRIDLAKLTEKDLAISTACAEPMVRSTGPAGHRSTAACAAFSKMRFRPNGVFPETTEGGSRLRGRAFFVRSVVSPTDHWMQGFGPGPMCILAKRENLTLLWQR